jgi:hypothetical protein
MPRRTDSAFVRDQDITTPPHSWTTRATIAPTASWSRTSTSIPKAPPPHGVIQIMFVISDGGRHIHEVVSEFTPPGFTEPQPTQTSADDWKVASEKDH